MNLSEFIDILKDKDDILFYDKKVNSEFEVSKISREILETSNKAIIFKNVDNLSVKLATNLFSKKERIDIVLNNKKLKDIDTNNLNNKFIYLKNTLNSQTKDLDLRKFPAIKAYKNDGGKYFNFACVITKSPITNKQNMGIYRLQLFDDKNLGLHWHTYNKEENHFEEAKKLGLSHLEVAILLSTDPIHIFAAGLPFKYEIDEFSLFETIYDKKLEIVKCKTIDLFVPKSSEIVLEGIVKTNFLQKEGPYFMHTGKYDLPTMQPVFNLRAIFNNKDCIMPNTFTGIPYAENSIMMSYLMEIFFQEIKTEIPELIDFHMPIEGVFKNLLYIKINQNIESEKIFNKLRNNRLFKNIKNIILFNENDNFNNLHEVIWKIGNSKIYKLGKYTNIDTRIL